MKVLSLQQPWATLVAIGAKKIETRSWSTNYRGPLAIHASKAFPGWAKALCVQEPFYEALVDGWYRPRNIVPSRLWKMPAHGLGASSILPFGAIVCVCDLVDVVPITPDNIPPEPERSFGLYILERGPRYAWHLANVRALPVPIPVKRGMLGLWVPDPDVLAQLEEFGRPIRAGDTVHHGPTGETWYLLGVNQKRGEVCVAGWPPTIARLSDCAFVRPGSGITAVEREHRAQNFGEGWDE